MTAASMCPVAHGVPFDPTSVQAAQDPQPWLSVARHELPVYWDEQRQVFAVTRYRDIKAILQDPATFSSRYTNKFRPMTSPALAGVFPKGHPGQYSMTLQDPPAHNRIRRLANQAFAPRIVNAMEPTIRARCEQLVDTFVADGRAELLLQYAQPLPVYMMKFIAGAQDSDLDVSAWGPDYFALTEGAPPMTEDRAVQIAARSQKVLDWFTEYVELRRRRPTNDLVSALIQARSDEGDAALTTDEVIAVLSAMMSAGIETTAVFIPILVRHLLLDDTLRTRVTADPALYQTFVEEGLRYYPPARGVRRTAMCDTEVAGVTIPQGSDLFLYYVSANFDGDEFRDPERFDIDRPRLDRHLSFGRGTHFCIGAPLARLEIRVALEVLLRRLPDVRLASEAPIQWLPHMTLPRPTGVEVVWPAA